MGGVNALDEGKKRMRKEKGKGREEN